MSQSYANHTHQPAATMIGYVFVLVALAGWAIGGRWSGVLGFWGLIGAIVTLLAISRTYITRLQDRIIKLEMKVRVATVLGPEQVQRLSALNTKQIAALRFASDQELGALLERAVKESLKPDDIKRAIKHWVPDLDRT